jgi:hypothetical protein
MFMDSKKLRREGKCGTSLPTSIGSSTAICADSLTELALRTGSRARTKAVAAMVVLLNPTIVTNAAAAVAAVKDEENDEEDEEDKGYKDEDEENEGQMRERGGGP